MNKIIAKIIATILSVITFVNTIPVFAASPSLTNEKNTNTTVGLGTTNTNVYLNVADNNIIVSTPTTIILDSKFDENGNNVGKYSIKVKGDVSGDKILTVEPDSTKISLNQKGKESTSANINQAKTTFTSDELAKETITTGTITSETLTAGSWNSSFNFNIGVNSMYHYYSSVELAVKDANNGNYDNADIENTDDPQAIAGLINTSAGANICMLNNENNCNSLVLSKNTNFHLGGHTLEFAYGNNITYEKDLSIFNGNLYGQDVTLIKGTKTNTKSKLDIENVNIELNCTTNLNINISAVSNYCEVNNLNNLSVKLFGDGNSSYSNIGLSLKNGNSTNEVKNYEFNSTVKKGKNIRGGQIAGTSIFTNPNINIVSNSVTLSFGLSFLAVENEKPNIIVNKAKIKVVTNSGSATGIRSSNNGKLTINGGNIEASSVKDYHGTGISLSSSTNLEINSSDVNPVIVFGKLWGIETSPFGKTVINGGIYTSSNHQAYIQGNADIYDAEFYLKNKEQYKDISYGLYCGGTDCPPNAIVNFTRCTIGNPQYVSQEYERTIVSQLHYEYTAPSNINFTDCNLYSGTYTTFCFNFGNKDKPNPTKFNLYGNTVIYNSYNKDNNCWNILSKEQLNNSIKTWKKIYRETKSEGACVGDKIITGNENAVVDDKKNVLDVYVTNDANVYDYR